MNKIILKTIGVITASAGLFTMSGYLPQNLSVFADETFYTRDPFYNFSSDYNYYTSQHFQFIWGKSGTSSAVTDDFLKGNAQNLENCWSVYTDELGMDTPSQSVDSLRRDGKNYKINIYISGTGLSGMTDDWAYMSYDPEQYPYLFVCTDAMQYDPPSWVLPHELGHAFTAAQLGWNDNKYSQGWWEAMGNWFREQYLYSDYSNDQTGHGTDFFETYMKNLSLTFPSGRDYYAAWPFFQYLTENPDNLEGYGKTFVKKMLQEGQKDEYPFDMVQRLSKADIKETFGNFAKRMATLDFAQKANYNARLNELLAQGDWNYNEIYTYLEKKDDSDWYYVPTERAPQHAGLNIIPLDIKDSTISASLEGITNIKGADWRACIVAEGSDGKTYYSPLFKSGETQSLNVQNATKAYLTVIATPDGGTYKKIGLPYGSDSEFAESKLGFKEKEQYPYKVKLSGAGIHHNQINTGGIPGHIHSNGGGFVADTANVDSSVYVGKNAKVLGFASVSGNARIEDNAVVEGSAKVSGNAVIKDYAMICESGNVEGNAVVSNTAQVMGNATITGNASVSESALVYGNYKISDNAKAKGMAFCMANGSLSGEAVVDGDWYDDGGKTSSKGTSYGWVSDQNYVNSRPYTDGMTSGYDFDSDSSKTFQDKYNSSYGISVNNPLWEEERTGAKGVLTYNGKDNYLIIGNDVTGYESTSEIDVKALYRGGEKNQNIFSIGGNLGITLTPENSDGLPELSYDGKKVIGKTPITKGMWYDYDIEISPDSITLKINSANGKEESKITGNFSAPYKLISNDSYSYIGRGESGNYFNGSVDSFETYYKDVDLKYNAISQKEDIKDNPEYPQGDVNHDGKTDMKDVKELQEFIIKKSLNAPIDGDIDGNGKINSIDLVHLKQIVKPLN